MEHVFFVRSEWNSTKEKWFHGETMDPVFEGVVRDFCTFDDAMQNVQTKVQEFMKGVEQMAVGLMTLSDGVANSLSHSFDNQIASDSCKLKEAANQIARSDAPHSAISKLRRDMLFNILNPVQAHLSNNRNLKVSLDLRRRRLVEYTSAKKQFEECCKKNLSKTDRRYLQAQSNLEAARSTFTDVDRHVFEWLYILEQYRGDILDSTLQTLKYLQYEFFATSSHTLSNVLPSRMEFRPMVEMTPDHLEAQVEMELQRDEEPLLEGSDNGPGAIMDFSLRLIEKNAKEDPGDTEEPSHPVDPLSLSSLLSQGFDEGPARRALRIHHNDTQAALDWLIDGGTEEAQAAQRTKELEEGVRIPTTVKRLQKLKAMRKKQKEKTDEGGSRRTATEHDEGNAGASQQDGDRSSSSTSGSTSTTSRKSDAPSERPSATAKKKDQPTDLLEVEAPQRPAQDLLGFDTEEPAVPTDFSKPVDMVPLPQIDLLYDGGSRCEVPPLPTSVAAGTALPRSQEPQSKNAQGFSPELLAQAQALASSMGVSPEQLLLAAAQQSQPSGPQAPQRESIQSTAPAMGMYSSPSPGSPSMLAGSGSGTVAPLSGLAALDPFENIGVSPQAPGAGPPPPRTGAGYAAAPNSAPKAEDQFGGLMDLVTSKS